MRRLGVKAWALPLSVLAAWAGLVVPACAHSVYVALGDSLARGVGAHLLRGYAYRFHTMLKTVDPDVRLINLGQAWAKSGDALASGALERAVQALPSVVTIHVGANDVRRAGSGPAARAEAIARLKVHLAAMLARLTSGTDADIYVLEYYDPWAACTAGDADQRRWVDVLNKTIRDVAHRFGVTAVPVGEAFAGREAELTWIHAGDVHPTSRGHQQIAEAVWAAHRGTVMNRVPRGPAPIRPVLSNPCSPRFGLSAAYWMGSGRPELEFIATYTGGTVVHRLWWRGARTGVTGYELGFPAGDQLSVRAGIGADGVKLGLDYAPAYALALSLEWVSGEVLVGRAELVPLPAISVAFERSLGGDGARIGVRVTYPWE